VIALVEKAFAERAAKNKEADQTWQRAIYMAQGNGGALQILSLMAEANRWTFATGRTLAALANLASGNLETWRRLARHEAMTGNLAGYHSALTGMMRINPFDITVSSDWVLSCVLLRKDNPDAVLKVAERAYGSTYPANPAAATAYAIALLGTNRPAEALDVISRMSKADQQSTERTVYIGAILAANGRQEEALEFLERAGGINELRFSEEMGFRRIWEGIARGEESATAQLDRILNQRATWQEESERIALDVRREIEVRYDPLESRRILEDLKNQNEQRKQSPAELQRLLRDLHGSASPTPAPQVP
jgi:tetratricopeptide (TPR) repeat protein